MTTEAEALRRAWGRVVRWLERNAPKNAATLQTPTTPERIADAEARLKVAFPEEVRTWLLTNGGVEMEDTGHDWKSPGPDSSFIPNGWHLLSLDDMVRVHERRLDLHQSSGIPDDGEDAVLAWRREWLPFVVERDELYGRFVDTRTGMVGRWSDGDVNRFGMHDSLAEYFQVLADTMETRAHLVDGRIEWR
ncbi:SMI1/KNR4 family protein [Streptomyces sp. NPDC101776]|uniref:SMI1/KNR4 family protein n=1 Tax=Streptomyces sp. NPDC101776 TaxID=3366146 RepID=UPI003828074A